MYIRATYKFKEYKHNFLKRNFNINLTDDEFLRFYNGDHMEIDNTLAQTLINEGMAQPVWNPN